MIKYLLLIIIIIIIIKDWFYVEGNFRSTNAVQVVSIIMNVSESRFHVLWSYSHRFSLHTAQDREKERLQWQKHSD